LIKFAVFASGSGSNFQAIVNAVNNGNLRGELTLLICDKPGAKVIERAKNENIPFFVFSPRNYESKADYEKEILLLLKEKDVQFIVLAGYMRLIGETLLSAYEGKIVNIHPSLLPAFPGKDAIGQAIRAGVKVTGVTVHYVDEGMDTGPIIAQKAIEILEKDNEITLQEKIHQIEHDLYPKVLNELFQQLENK
jgi:phosphoribosylglycinamide formyltransferase 1